MNHKKDLAGFMGEFLEGAWTSGNPYGWPSKTLTETILDLLKDGIDVQFSKTDHVNPTTKITMVERDGDPRRFIEWFVSNQEIEQAKLDVLAYTLGRMRDVLRHAKSTTTGGSVSFTTAEE